MSKRKPASEDDLFGQFSGMACGAEDEKKCELNGCHDERCIRIVECLVNPEHKQLHRGSKNKCEFACPFCEQVFTKSIVHIVKDHSVCRECTAHRKTRQNEQKWREDMAQKYGDRLKLDKFVSSHGKRR